MIPLPRIYVSVPLDRHLTPGQKRMKAGILRKIRDAGFEPQEFFVSGLCKSGAWNFDRVMSVMKRCHGAVIIGFSQWVAGPPNDPVVMPTEYNHFETAAAAAFEKATFMMKDEAVAWRGAFYSGGGFSILDIPATANQQWLRTPAFTDHFDHWVHSVKQRHHIFFGYSSAAADTANRILKYLNSIGVDVRDWQTDFRPAAVILDEIEIAAKSCLGGVFLFTKDDEIVAGDTTNAAPRDNVVFEAGYFMHAVGRERTLIIRETTAKMPADLGGGLYSPLSNRRKTSAIETDLRKFLETQL